MFECVCVRECARERKRERERDGNLQHCMLIFSLFSVQHVCGKCLLVCVRERKWNREGKRERWRGETEICNIFITKHCYQICSACNLCEFRLDCGGMFVCACEREKNEREGGERKRGNKTFTRPMG